MGLPNCFVQQQPSALVNFLDIQVRTHLLYEVVQPCDLLLQVEAARDDVQKLILDDLSISPALDLRWIEGEDGIGQRIWLHAETGFECLYETKVSVIRKAVDLNLLEQSPLPSLPGDVVKYLMSSRYCHSEKFHDFTAFTFGKLAGGARIRAMRDWIIANLKYVPGASNAQTTAHETLASREGVCRDYAHVLIVMARSSAIPARMVSAYAPDVEPQDFHAVVEVYLDGAWHLIDPTGMAKEEEIIRIGVGRDAADVSFLTAYGTLQLKKQTVEVDRLTHISETPVDGVEDRVQGVRIT